jgi:acyl carrier protein
VDVTDESTVDEVKTVLIETLGIEDRAATIDRSTLLLGGLPEFDSMAVIALVSAIEERFGFAFDDEDITGDVFESVGSLAAHVQRHRA